jgi:hypothetical protein
MLTTNSQPTHGLRTKCDPTSVCPCLPCFDNEISDIVGLETSHAESTDALALTHENSSSLDILRGIQV